jgi:hypothetical protein
MLPHTVTTDLHQKDLTFCAVSVKDCVRTGRVSQELLDGFQDRLDAATGTIAAFADTPKTTLEEQDDKLFVLGTMLTLFLVTSSVGSKDNDNPLAKVGARNPLRSCLQPQQPMMVTVVLLPLLPLPSSVVAATGGITYMMDDAHPCLPIELSQRSFTDIKRPRKIFFGQNLEHARADIIAGRFSLPFIGAST